MNLRSIIPEVVNKFLDCGDLEHGFARIRCDHCKIDHLLAFSCKGRWFCPSCHQKKVQLFGALLAESILNPARAPPDVERIVELFPGDPFLDYSMDAVMDYDICADA